MKIVGADIGKRNDPSALMMVEGDPGGPRRKIVGCDSLPLGLNYNDQSEEIRKFCFGADFLFMDGTGVGEAVADIIRPGLEIPLWTVGITGGKNIKVSWEHQAVNVPKRALINHVVNCVEKGVLSHDVQHAAQSVILHRLWNEMRVFEERGKKLEAALGKHDDLTLALALGLFGFTVVRIGQEEVA